MQSLTRRTFFFALVSFQVVADESGDRTAITEMFAAVAASLSEDNPSAALKWFDPSMSSIGQLRAALFALVEKYEVSSAISILSIENGNVVLDWFLELKSRGSFAPVVRRRADIKCQIVKKGKSWRIISLDPIQFFE